MLLKEFKLGSFAVPWCFPLLLQDFRIVEQGAPSTDEPAVSEGCLAEGLLQLPQEMWVISSGGCRWIRFSVRTPSETLLSSCCLLQFIIDKLDFS